MNHYEIKLAKSDELFQNYKYWTIRQDAEHPDTPGWYRIVGSTGKMFQSVSAAKEYIDKNL